MRLRTAETLSLAARFYRRYLWSWDVTAGFLAALVAAADLAGGSVLFALAIGVAGVYRSMVVVGSMPLMAQGIAWAAGSERPSAL
ncbi:MAG: hypothetical protein RXR09_06885, partial [Acidilobus sp.]